MAAPFRVKALYEYTSPHNDDLNFPLGQVITVTDEEDAEWYGGEYIDGNGVKKEGIFPRNFVEKIEPARPPRPARSRTKRAEENPAQGIETEKREAREINSPPTPTASSLVPHEEAETKTDFDEPKVPMPDVPGSKEHEPTSPVAPPQAMSAFKPKSSTSAPDTEKPATSSFKDRIAAFNKPAAAPIAPFKPSGLTGSSFIKKPFVPPPPSRDAYVPIPREQTAQNIYRRSEDPDIKKQEAQNQEQAEKAGLYSHETKPEASEADRDQPKPTSLKERIALLAKQQQEQAQRHADAVAKKEKPKKPAKKKPEISAAEATEEMAEGADLAPLERKTTETTIGRNSLDDEAPLQSPLPPRRKASRGPVAELHHDGNEADMSGAGDTTEGQYDTSEREDEDPKHHASQPASIPALSRAPTTKDASKLAKEVHTEKRHAEEEEEEQEEEVEEEDDVDPEIKKREELRARMAKMSGGMGFHGMFGAPMPPVTGLPKRNKPEKPPTGEEAESRKDETQRSAPPIPTPMALPGMGGRVESQEPADETEEPASSLPSPPPVPRRATTNIKTGDVDSDKSNSEDGISTPGPASRSDPPRALPSMPGGRSAPPPVPSEPPRPPLPTSASDIKSPTEGSESDDELSGGAKGPEPTTPQPTLFPVRSPPLSPRADELSAFANRRNSRPPPPVPGSAPALPSAASRPPPPPPPSGHGRPSNDGLPVASSRPVFAGELAGEESTEYEGDYDTDIASSAPHKDALKAHARDSSIDESLVQSPTMEVPQSRPPPIPPTSPPRAIPPPIPPVAAIEGKRGSIDAPRAAPPPPPPPPAHAPKEPTPSSIKNDLYSHSSPTTGGTLSKSPKIEERAHFAETSSSPVAQSASDRRPPLATGPRSGGRQSMDVPRTSTSIRRSVDIHRQSLESGFIANDLDLAVQSGWWKQANQLPPVLQGRRDIFFESEESTTNNHGVKTVITREIFILFLDYSQTIITVRFDPYNQNDVELDQKHEGPPRTLRQDEMEDFYDRFGRQIIEAAQSKKDTVVGDGTPQGLVLDLVRPLKGALWPVGTRAYGALVYSNMANASTQQYDVIRPGDIVSFRSSKFQGKHGPMHAKYSAEVGKPDHVAVVAEWDGTKKKLRAWEQGRENKKVKMESYKLDDLRSGEVKVWRVVARNWVGWNSQP